MEITVTVNGVARTDDVEPRTLLVQYLRETRRLTGTNVGCDTSSCGACTVLIDGRSAKSCTLLAAQADGREVTTIEGLAPGDGSLHPMQQSFHECHALQCGYCTPGMVMASVSLLEENPSPTEADVRVGLEGNLCRCTGYHNIVKAVLAAAGEGIMTVTDTPTESVIGSRRLRKEDPALLTGEAKYIDDLDLPGALWVACVRSPFAHARITSVETAEASAVDGVVAVYSGADLADGWVAPLPCAWPVNEDMKNPEHFPVAAGKANYAGDIVAVVVADDRVAAADAAELVAVDYEPLTAVVDLEDARADSTVIHDDLGTNVSYTWELIPDAAAVDAAFAAATHTVSGHFIQQRLIPAAMEPRGVAAVPAPFGGDITLYSSTQVPHILKVMAAITLGVPEHRLRVVAPSVGGGFGSKLNVYAEEILCTRLALEHGVPVRWTETRSEGANSTIQGRGQIQDIELAADADGRLTAVRVNLLADMGAYLQLVTPGVPLLGAFLYHGVYDVPHYSFSCTSVFTNLTPTDAYRGAGRPEATYAIERAMDILATEIGVDPAEIRRRNYIQPEQFPYDSCAGLTFDSGNYEPTLTRALEMIDHDGVRAEQARRRAEGSTKHLGIGMSTYVEMCGLAPSRVLASLNYSAGGWEAATVRILPTAKVQVVTGTTPHGQGHETSWSMIVADKLGVDPDDVDVLHSDTAISPLGLDTYGSRSLSVGGTAVAMACDKVLEKARKIAAHQMEASEDDLEFSGGTFGVRGQPGAEMPLAAIAFEAFTAHDLPDDVEPNLEAQVTWDPPNFTFPFGTHVAVVEIDEETGGIELVDYAAVDDCGNQINPLIVEGQVHGGILQGVAQALWEEAVVDETGQPLNTSLGNYLVPSPTETPSFKLDHTITPSPTNQLGVKGVGEAGTIGAAPTVVNAVVDALSPFGISDIDMPAAPAKLWRMIRDAKEDRPVIPAAFDYIRAGSADEAIAAVGEHGDEAKFLAGGHSLLPMMKLRLARPSVLIDVGRLDDLRYIRDGGDHVAIGALTRHAELESSDLLGDQAPILRHVASQVGDPAVRHHGTLGGSLAHADPASDLPAAMLALGGTLVARGPNGTREIAASDFFTGLFESVLAPDELLTEIRVPKVPVAGWSYQKFNRRAQDWAIVAAAAVNTNDGTQVALVNMGSTPVRAGAVEAALAGGASAADAAAQAADGTSPPSDLNGDAEYRRALAEVLVRRALTEAGHA